MPGFGIHFLNGDDILSFIIPRCYLAEPSGYLIFIVEIPADYRNMRFFGNVPEASFDGCDALASAFRDDCKEKFIPLGKPLHHLVYRTLGRIPIDRYAAERFENNRCGKEEPILFYHNVTGSLDDFKPEKGSDGIHIGRMGKSDQDMLMGHIIRQRFKSPVRRPVEKFADQT